MGQHVTRKLMEVVAGLSLFLTAGTGLARPAVLTAAKTDDVGRVVAQNVPNGVAVDPPHQPGHAPAMLPVAIRSHGDTLNGVLYTAAGPGRHPTVLLLHGLPGNEQNLDLAQAMRREGWNVMTFHYRGSWGSSGAFSIGHCTEDVATALAWLRNPASKAAVTVDPKRIVVIGHSLGGLLAAYASAHDRAVMAIGMISAADIPHQVSSFSRAALVKAMDDNIGTAAGLKILAGTSPELLAAEIIDHGAAWDFVRYHEALGRRPLLLVTSDDGFTEGSETLARLIRESGQQPPTTAHIATDHSYSDARIRLTVIVLRWLDTLVPPPQFEATVGR